MWQSIKCKQPIIISVNNRSYVVGDIYKRLNHFERTAESEQIWELNKQTSVCTVWSDINSDDIKCGAVCGTSQRMLPFPPKKKAIEKMGKNQV